MKQIIRAGLRTLLVVVLVGWWGVAYVRDKVADTVSERLNRVGLNTQSGLTLVEHDFARINHLSLNSPINVSGFEVDFEVESVSVPVNPWALTDPGLPIAGAISVHGVHLSLTQKLPVPPQKEAIDDGTAPHHSPKQALLDQIALLCPSKCRIRVSAGRSSLTIPGLDLGSYQQMSGYVDLHGDGYVQAQLLGNDAFELTAKVNLNHPAEHTITVRHPKRVALDGKRFGHNASFEGTCDTVRLHNGQLALSHVEGTLSTPKNHWLMFSAKTIRTDLNRIQDCGVRCSATTLVGLDVKAFQNERQVLEGHVGHARLGSKGLWGCGNLPVCPETVVDFKLNTRWPEHNDLQLTAEAHGVEPCGVRCNRWVGVKINGHYGSSHLNAKLDQIVGHWSAQTMVPSQLTLSDGQVSGLWNVCEPSNASKPPSQACGPKAAIQSVWMAATSEVNAASAARSSSKRRQRKRYRKRKPKPADLAQVVKLAAQSLNHQFSRHVQSVFRHTDSWQTLAKSQAPALTVRNVSIQATVKTLDSHLAHGDVEYLKVAPKADALNVVGDVNVNLPKHWRLDTDSDASQISTREVRTSGTALSAAFDLSLNRSADTHVQLSAQTPHIYVSHEKIAPTRIDIAPITIWGQLDHTTVDDTVSWDIPQLRVLSSHGGYGDIAANIELKTDGRTGRLKTRIGLPMQRCDRIYNSIPPAMLPSLQGAQFEGSAQLELSANAPLKTVADLDIKLASDFSACRAKTLGKHIDIDALNRKDSVFNVHDPKLKEPVRVGPGTGNWVSIKSIPKHIMGAAMATEDGNFLKHQGFMPQLMLSGLKMNLRNRKYVYGGSTITQQLVKNIFLTRQKTLARKLEEAVLVWQVERHVPKNRIMALYLNCIEYGPNVYGIRQAARAYFKTNPADLKPLESAYIMNIKPFPRQGYYLFKRGALTAFWKKRSQMIRKKLLKYRMITPEEAEEMVPEKLYDRFKPEEPPKEESAENNAVESKTSVAQRSSE